MMFKRFVGVVGLLLLSAVPALAQITVPNTFAPQQVISSSKFNQNFSELATKGLNRTAAVLQSTLAVDVTGTYDLGSSGARFHDLWLTGSIFMGNSIVASGGITSTTGFNGPGAGLTGLHADQINGTLPTATQDAITRLGTIVSGLWHGSVIPVQYGGTNADLSATGGAHKFLKQETLGGPITVGVITAADFDTSDFASLSGTNLFTGSNTFDILQVSNSLTVTGSSLALTGLNAGFEVGAPGSSNTPFLDFHSSASVTDYDVRMLASGGSASTGAGSLSITATATSVSGTFQALGGYKSADGSAGVTKTCAAGSMTVKNGLIISCV